MAASTDEKKAEPMVVPRAWKWVDEKVCLKAASKAERKVFQGAGHLVGKKDVPRAELKDENLAGSSVYQLVD
jgi:uncharacterized protein YbaP (TraB family)